MCTLASIVLLFTVGLETDIALFLRYSVAGSLVGLGGVIVSFVAGDGLAAACSSWLLGRPLGFFDGPCLLMGIVMTATSVGITARILSEQRKLESPEGVTLLAGAVVDDVLGIILLAIGLGVVAASRASGRMDWGHIGVIGAKAAGIWLVATAVGLVASRKISALLKSFGNPTTIAVLALGMAFLLAGLFEEAGLAMIIGAYVMGLTLARTDIKHVVRERLAPAQALLVPVFFVGMGMFVNVRAFLSPAVFGFGLLYTAVAIAAKLVGCGLPALFCGFNGLGALRIGTGMLPRGEVTLIIAGTGLALGILNADLFGVAVLTTLLSSLTTPPALVHLFRVPHSGLRRPPPEASAAPLVFRFPSVLSTELMVDRLLAEFQSEGYYAHLLNRVDQLYQLRKDDVVIGFRRRANELRFQCRPADVPLVRAAMLEVVADLEQIVREARRPADVAGAASRAEEPPGSGVVRASLARYLAVSLLVPALKGETKPAVIDELLERLRAAGHITDLAAARAAVWQRERSLSTGMQHGIAMPHARTDAAPALVCAIGLKRAGVAFDSIDGRPARIIILTLSPECAAAPHLQLLAALGQALDEAGRATLLAASTPVEMYVALAGIPPRGRARSGWTGFLGRWRPAPKPGLDLAEFLRPEWIVPELAGRTPAEVIDELLSRLAAEGAVRDAALLRTAILEREQRMPTGLDHGVAFPHARSEAVPRLVCAVGLARDGVEFGACSGEPARIVLLTVAPARDPGTHVRVLAMLGRALNAERRKRILAARTAREIWAALTAADR